MGQYGTAASPRTVLLATPVNSSPSTLRTILKLYVVSRLLSHFVIGKKSFYLVTVDGKKKTNYYFATPALKLDVIIIFLNVRRPVATSSVFIAQ